MPITISSTLQTESASVDEKGGRQYRRSYLIETDDALATAVQVGAVLPAWGTAHPDDANARCIRVSAEQRKGDPLHWDGEAEWTTQHLQSDRGTRAQNAATPPTSPGGNSTQTAPNLRPWVWSWSGTKRTEHVFQDRTPAIFNGPLPVVNAAGQPFDTGLEIPRNNALLHITAYKAYEAVSPGVKIFAYLDAVNDKPWLGAAKYEARVVEYKETTVYEQGVWFWEIQVGIEFQRGGWNPVKILNAGTMKKKSSLDPKLVPILDRHGNPVTAPVPLKADGTDVLEPTGTPNYIEFFAYDMADFTFLI